LSQIKYQKQLEKDYAIRKLKNNWLKSGSLMMGITVTANMIKAAERF
jgi:hypothetical protein